MKNIAEMKQNEGQIWITSDTHYSHRNICRGVTEWKMPDGSIPIAQTRDFSTIQKMNDAMVNGINSVVMQDDILIHLGDWSFGGFESIREFHDRLVCKNIHFILGNHDKHILTNKSGIRELFLSVDKENDVYEVGEYHFHLHHYPIMSWRDMKQGTMHLHGHCHSSGDNRFGKGKKMDIGIDGHPEFRPYNLLMEVVPLLISKPISSEYETVLDHHIDKIKHRY